MKRAESRNGDESAASGTRIASIRKGASGTATIAAGGSSFFVSLAQLEELGFPVDRLASGFELDEGSLSLLSLAAEAHEAERRGLALLARAEQSAFMLRIKLEAREFSKRSIGLAIARLEAEGFLDDQRFASAFAESRLRRRTSKAEGPASLVFALRERGIARELAAEAVAALMGEEGRRSALEAAARKELKRSSGDRDMARRKLRALGYKSDEISECFESL